MMRGARGRGRAIFFGILLFLVFGGAAMSRFYTDLLWFQEVGFESVLWKTIAVRLLVGAVVGLAVAIVVWLNLTLASRMAPAYRTDRLDLGGRRDPFEEYRDFLTPRLASFRTLIAGGVGFLVGATAGASWRTYLLWANRVEFGEVDPQFGRDIGFYIFELPFYNLILSWAWVALVAALVLSAFMHFFHGAIRAERGLSAVMPKALGHLSVLLGLLAVVKAGQYWLGTYALNFSDRGVVTGASYTDVHAQLPALRLLAIISLFSAVLFLVNIRMRRVSLPLAAVGIWVLVSVLAGGLWPWSVQRFSVEPQEPQRERPYIARNIASTRAGFGLSDVEDRPFAARVGLTAEDLEDNEILLQNVRLWDPDILAIAYRQVQSIRPYYDFPDVDIDRYEVDGQTRQVLLSGRELSLAELGETSSSWTNLHLNYTHGYGVVASLANEATEAGAPQFLVREVPGVVAEGAESLQLEQERLYYAEAFDTSDYSVVNTDQQEIDFPTEGERAQRFRYDGDGGIPMGGLFRRIAFALREGDPNLVLSGLINEDSKILIYREVRDRVLRAAPFLALDHDPYFAVVDGQPRWIFDAYTTSPYYPYSQRFRISDLVQDSDHGGLGGDVNYIRNSVKVVVDAYNGTMDYYVIDENDPLIQAWRGAFPDLFTTEAPSESLRAHFRYPEDLFDIQSQVFLRYHMNDPADFYAREDEWALPLLEESDVVPATYLLINLPGETEEEFVITRPFTPRAKNNMIALMVARSDPEVYGELLTLQLPRQASIVGPKQVNNLLNQDPRISETRTLLGESGSDLIFGSLTVLPIDESILYIQPLFVEAEDGGIPELKFTALVHGEEVAFEETFDEALASLFDLEAPTEEPTEEPGEEPGEEPAPSGRLEEIVAEASEVYAEAQEALAAGDFARYGELIEELGQLIDEARGLSESRSN